MNINEAPDYHSESSPFGGVKDFGLYVKEEVFKAMKAASFVTTFGLP